MPNATITAGDILTQSGQTVTDAELRTACANCPGEVTLAQCKVTPGKETTYSCPICGDALVVVFPATPGVMGYRFNKFQIRPVQDLRYRPAGASADVLIPKIAQT